MADDKEPVIIIKKIKKGGDGGHGGAWKVAYADFVTAMMAFFLLLWLLNVTTDEQKDLISAYFSPADPRVSESVSGSGGVMGGQTMSPDGAQVSDREPVVGQPGPPAAGAGKESGDEGEKDLTDEELMEELRKRDEEAFKKAEEELRQAIESVPELKNLAQNLLIDMTPEGLRIQIVDQEGKPMFPLGKSDPLEITKKLLRLVAKVVQDMPNRISVRGHTDSRPYGPGAKYTNWELSADRANASRRELLTGGLEIPRIENVMGKADREHLVPAEPYSARNRRISIILLRQSIVPGVEKKKDKKNDKSANGKNNKPAKPKTKKREEGIIYFP